MSQPSSPQKVDISEGSILPTDKTTYRVEKQLGEGGFGVVCQVTDGNNEYALKLTKMWEFMPNERLEYATRFKQEYDYGKDLKSSYLVRSHDYGLIAGNPFMTMDFCKQGSVRDLVGHSISSSELDELAFGILNGLSELHNQGIIHRDIKPENILLDAKNTPKLADFGISASIKKRHTQANIMGHAKAVFATCVYSPPEQMDHTRAMKVMGNTNDIYAFGATIFELITGGFFPFGNFDDFLNNMKSFELKRKKGEWDKSRLHGVNTESKWVSIIEKCLAYNPEDRFQHAEEIISLIGFQKQENKRHEYIITNETVWSLVIKNGDEIGRVYNISNLQKSLQKPYLTIGWLNPENPFINDIGLVESFTQFISSQHATLEYDIISNYWFIRDGQIKESEGVKNWQLSTNGILINSKMISSKPIKLNPDDIIMIGDTTLKVNIT